MLEIHSDLGILRILAGDPDEDSLISSPVTWNAPRLASSIAKYPGPGATSRTLAPARSPIAMRHAAATNSGMSFRVVAAYHVAIPPSIPSPL
jgi:hypothetical protein